MADPSVVDTRKRAADEALCEAANAYVWNPTDETMEALRNARGEWQTATGLWRLAKRDATPEPSVVDALNTLREWVGQHTSGLPMDDRGDGFHWLTCIDCGVEWAENDDGSHASGQVECAAPKFVAALAVVETALADQAAWIDRVRLQQLSLLA